METKRVARRKHSAEFRDEVIQACRQPGASVAAIALRSGLNANVVYRWLSNAIKDPTPQIGSIAPVSLRSSLGFLPVQLPQAAVAPTSNDIRLELRRGDTSVTVNWPVQCSSDCAALLRDWLR
jgi:transposase